MKIPKTAHNYNIHICTDFAGNRENRKIHTPTIIPREDEDWTLFSIYKNSDFSGH